MSVIVTIFIPLWTKYTIPSFSVMCSECSLPIGSFCRLSTVFNAPFCNRGDWIVLHCWRRYVEDRRSVPELMTVVGHLSWLGMSQVVLASDVALVGQANSIYLAFEPSEEVCGYSWKYLRRLEECLSLHVVS